MSYINFFDHPPQEFQFFAPSTRRISFTFFVDFLLQKVEKCHPPTESQTCPDYPPTESQNFSDHPHMEFFKGVRHHRPYILK